IELVVTRERLNELEVVNVATIPAADRTAGERQIRVYDDSLRIEEVLHAQPVAGRTGARRVVEREQLRLERRDAVAANRAGVSAGEHQLFPVRLIQKCQARQSARQA